MLQEVNEHDTFPSFRYMHFPNLKTICQQFPCDILELRASDQRARGMVKSLSSSGNHFGHQDLQN